MPDQIVIYCDSDGHAVQEATIRTMRRGPDGWDEDTQVSTRLKINQGAAERTIPAPAFHIIDPGSPDGYLRWRFPCPLNDKHNVQVRQVNLNPALDLLAGAGASRVSLRGLAATLERLARARPGARDAGN